MVSLFYSNILMYIFYQIYLTFQIKANYEKCPNQKSQHFIIKKFDLTHPGNARGVMLSISIIAELNHKVQAPYIEGQIINDRIPVLRFHDPLCRPGVLVCPASFSQLVYGNQIAIPSTLEPGDYKLRLLFREGKDILSCYETPITIKEQTEMIN